MMVHGKVEFAKLEKKKDGEPYLSVTFTPDKHFVNFSGKKENVKYYVTFWENAETHLKVLKKGNKGNLYYKKSDINVVEKNGKMNFYFNIEGMYFQVTSFSDYNSNNNQNENKNDNYKEAKEEKTIDLTAPETDRFKNNRSSSEKKEEETNNTTLNTPETKKIADFLNNLEKIGL